MSTDTPLPALRGELSLLPGARGPNGAPRWLIFDPLRNAYFQLGHDWFEMLRAWSPRVDDVRRAVRARVGRDPGEAAVTSLARFISDNELCIMPAEDAPDAFEAKAAKARRGAMSSMLHGYLFWRLPLVRPDRFLDAAIPVVAPFLTRTFAFIVTALGLLALPLLARQWSAFSAQFQQFLDLEGLVAFGLALVLVKVLHELGHAFVARRFGLSVPVMGIAFVVLMPILYTDTTHAWRLTSRRKRLLVDGAGIATELAIAVLATWAWLLMEDGPWRAAAFSLATAGWVMSLAVNLNPFMRFDGYHILSDLIGVENLQARGFALARWRLREALFGLGRPAPERLSRARRRLLVAHAVATWVYRFFLFLGIALLVYGFFVKLVGILLFVVEIAYFIALPVWRELKVWWRERETILARRRSFVSATLLGSAMLLCLLPLSSTVVVPAVLGAGVETALFPPRAARLVEARLFEGRPVRRGDVLARFEDDELELSIVIAQRKVALLRTRLARVAADAEDAALTQVLSSEERALDRELTGLWAHRAALTLRAPSSGTMVDVSRDLTPGRSVTETHRLARLAGGDGAKLAGLLRERDAVRVKGSAVGRFIPDDPALASVPVRLTDISVIAASRFDEPLLAQPNGGPVPAMRDEAGAWKPVGSHYRVRLAATETLAPVRQVRRGVAILEAERRSLAGRFLRRVAAILIRETGF